MKLFISCCLLLLINSITQLAIADNGSEEAAKPIFPDNYFASGVLSLPYAELKEPFHAWFDKEQGRSRNDFYGDLYKIYQFAPPKKEVNNSKEEYGVIYKLAYVPADFNQEKRSLIGKVRDAIGSHLSSSGGVKSNSNRKTQTKRACFKVNGGVGFTIRPQTVLPDISDFTFHSKARCPHSVNGRHHEECEVWKKVTGVGEKVNTYKLWLVRDKFEPNQVTPVLYSMTGYNNVFGSHYDRYDINYHRFAPGAANERDFHFDEGQNKCGPMPGPGFASSDSGQQRSQMIAINPFHEYISEPHRYDHIDHQFDEFAKEHSKDYSSDEHLFKSWHNFMHNLRFIHSKNRELQTYKLGVNMFADKHLNDLGYLRGRRRTKNLENNGGLSYAEHHQYLKGSNGNSSEKSIPDSWDWSIRGAVTPVKDQAVCGSCWSFGTSGTVEGAYFVKTGKLVRLSQQQMVDCSWKQENNGCDGGEDFRAYKYIMEAGGLATEEDYGHYLGVDGRCHDKDVKKAVKISGFYNVTANDREALKHAIVTYGPVSVSIDASPATFTFYSHGVYYDEKCNNSPDKLDHAVLAVGYTQIDGKFVWQVKNSWSTNWGNNGYIMMSAENNNCGVMDAPTVPIIEV